MREEGLTVIEVVVAGMILVIGGLGVLGIVDAASRNTFRAEQRQVVSNVLQREMEKIKALPYDEIALSSLPSKEGGENDPGSRVSGSAFYVNRNGTALKPLVAGGSVLTGPEVFDVGDVSGTIYRYVVWDDCLAGLCDDGEFLKRVIVAVKLDSTAAGGSERRYQELQGQLVDPEAEPSENPGPTPGGGTVTPWRLWLTDTSCDKSSRLEIEGDHLAHNTRGPCSNGPKTGNTPGAPDLLWPEAPPFTLETPVFDYAIDVEPEASPAHDKGLQILKGGDCGAMPATTIATAPDADASMFQKLHKWVTPPIPTEITNLTLTGDAILNLWTQSIESGVYSAQMCMWLFVREGSKDTALIKALGGTSYFTYTSGPWPSGGWTEIAIDMEFKGAKTTEVPLPPGSRLGLALSIDDGSGSGVQILYDEPSFDSRLELHTTGTIPSF
jgi:hypothetical protein